MKGSCLHEHTLYMINLVLLVVSGAMSVASVQGAVIASTWSFGKIATIAAANTFRNGGTSLDAVVEGITAVELDTAEQYFVGLGGLPNAAGYMELDAAVMCGTRVQSGAVMALRNIATAAKAARIVLEKSPHSILVGEGATEFVAKHGLIVRPDGGLTPEAKAEYEAWIAAEKLKATLKVDTPTIDRGHDTVGVICCDGKGNLACGTSTSGWKFKHPGRVGDSPVVGSGLYSDNSAGAAVATGDGEEILRTCLSFLVVELMRGGMSPAEAAREGIRRTVKIVEGTELDAETARMHPRLTVAVLAMSPAGVVGAASTLGEHNLHRGRPTFPYALWREEWGSSAETRIVEEERT